MPVIPDLKAASDIDGGTAAANPSPEVSLAVERALLGLLAILWGASYGLIKIGVASIPPVSLIAARTIIAALVLLAVLGLRRLSIPRDVSTWRMFLVQAVLNSVIPFTLLAWAQQSVDSSVAAILNSTSPLFAFLLAWTITRHEAATLPKLFGVIAGLVGICLIVGIPALYGLGRGLLAQLAIVAATCCYAVAAIYGRNFRSLDPMIPAAGSLVCGSTLLLPLSFALDRPWTLTPLAASVAAVLCLALFSTALALVVYFRLVRTLGAIGTTAQAYLRVPVAVAIGVTVLGETLTGAAWFGLALVIVGVAAMTAPFKPREAPDRSHSTVARRTLSRSHTCPRAE